MLERGAFDLTAFSISSRTFWKPAKSMIMTMTTIITAMTITTIMATAMAV